MKLVHKFGIAHGCLTLVMTLGATLIGGIEAGSWVLGLSLFEFVQLWLMFIRPIDLLLSSSNFEFSKSLGISEFDKIVGMLNSLSNDLEVQTEARKVATYMSEHDGLTGCYNRLGLNAREGIYSNYDNLYVLMFDINNLKKMNDEFGHKAGDALIKSAVEQLKYWLTYGDLFRIGGDEFLVVIAGKSEEECESMFADWNGCNMILNRIDDGFKCILSCGRAYGKGLSELMKLADERMYQNKMELKKEFGEEMR